MPMEAGSASGSTGSSSSSTRLQSTRSEACTAGSEGFSTNRTTRPSGAIPMMPKAWAASGCTGVVATVTCAPLATWRSSSSRKFIR